MDNTMSTVDETIAELMTDIDFEHVDRIVFEDERWKATTERGYCFVRNGFHTTSANTVETLCDVVERIKLCKCTICDVVGSAMETLARS